MRFGERFLAYPDLFPARRGGEPWGDRRLRLDLPGGPYRVAGLSARQAEAAGERFGEICREEAGGESGAAVEARLFAVAAGEFVPVDTRGWEYALDFDHRPSAVCLAGIRLMVRLDWAEGTGLASGLWTSEDGGAEGDLFPGIFENFLRVLVAYRLLELGGLVVHSAGVVDRGEAYLFLGRSGAGKTTLSRLSEAAGRSVLSDDLNALLPGPGGARVEKLPFTGDVGDRRRGAPAHPLARLLRLEKAAEDSLRPLSRAGAAAQLLACAPFVNVDPHRRERAAANAAELRPDGPGRGPRVHSRRRLLEYPDREPMSAHPQASGAVAAGRPIDLGTVLRRTSDVRYRVVDGEAVVVQQAAAEVLVLNETASRLLELADGATPLSAVAANLAAEFEVAGEVLAADLVAGARELVAAGLLEPVEGGR